MNLIIDPHVKQAHKMADAIFEKPPIEQQEMLEAIKSRIYLLNKIHLRKLGK
jgi:hypothetical protein